MEYSRLKYLIEVVESPYQRSYCVVEAKEELKALGVVFETEEEINLLAGFTGMGKGNVGGYDE